MQEDPQILFALKMLVAVQFYSFAAFAREIYITNIFLSLHSLNWLSIPSQALQRYGSI